MSLALTNALYQLLKYIRYKIVATQSSTVALSSTEK